MNGGRQIRSTSERPLRGAPLHRGWHLPPAAGSFGVLTQRQRDIPPPRPCRDLDIQWKPFRRGPDPHGGGWPSREIVGLRVAESLAVLFVEAGAVWQSRKWRDRRENRVVVFHEAQHRVTEQVPPHEGRER